MQETTFFHCGNKCFLSSFASFGYVKAGGAAASSGVGQVAFSMFSGGVGHALAGGNFWEGVKIGGIVALFNHLTHRIDGTFKSSSNNSNADDDTPLMKIMKSSSPFGDLNVESEQKGHLHLHSTLRDCVLQIGR